MTNDNKLIEINDDERPSYEDNRGEETEWNNNEPNEPDCGDENDIDERPLPDSDEDIIALMDENDVMEKIIERLTKERDEARRRTNSILTEIDCRIEHGADSNGHLEAIRSLFKET